MPRGVSWDGIRKPLRLALDAHLERVGVTSCGPVPGDLAGFLIRWSVVRVHSGAHEAGPGRIVRPGNQSHPPFGIRSVQTRADFPPSAAPAQMPMALLWGPFSPEIHGDMTSYAVMARTRHIRDPQQVICLTVRGPVDKMPPSSAPLDRNLD